MALKTGEKNLLAPFSNAGLLGHIRCQACSITNIDLSQNNQITTLHLASNSLSAINLSSLSLLSELELHNNQITNLNVSSNQSLTILKCESNLLSTLDVRNGNNINFTNFNALGNDSLFCIATDDSAWSILNWNNIPSHSFFSNYCTNYYTLIPDQVFEQNLIDKGYDFTIDGKVLTINIINITNNETIRARKILIEINSFIKSLSLFI